MSNRSEGNKFETELCEILSQYGFWVHNFTQNASGQPMDIIAVKNDTPILIDCKVCEKDRFVLSRIEPNQETTIQKWEKCGNCFSYFALKMTDGTIYMVSTAEILYLMDNGFKTLDRKHISSYLTLPQWLILREAIRK